MAHRFGEARQEHLCRLCAAVGGHLELHGGKGQERAACHFEHAHGNPPRTCNEHRSPPARLVFGVALGQEAQKVHLFANLHNQGKYDRGRRTEHQRVKAAATGFEAGQPRKVAVELGLRQRNPHERQHQQKQPQRLRPGLQFGYEGDAPHGQRQYHQGRHHITNWQRPIHRHLDGQGHDDRLQREEYEGEHRVHQRGDGGSQIAKARTARQQVHVQPVACGAIGNGQAGEEDDQPHHQNGPHGVAKAVVHGNGPANGLQRQERQRAKSCVGHPPLAPFAKAAGCIAQCVVLHAFVGHPGVVLAAKAENFLGQRRAVGRIGGHASPCSKNRPCAVRTAPTLFNVWAQGGVFPNLTVSRHPAGFTAPSQRSSS